MSRSYKQKEFRVFLRWHSWIFSTWKIKYIRLQFVWGCSQLLCSLKVEFWKEMFPSFFFFFVMTPWFKKLQIWKWLWRSLISLLPHFTSEKSKVQRNRSLMAAVEWCQEGPPTPSPFPLAVEARQCQLWNQTVEPHPQRDTKKLNR